MSVIRVQCPKCGVVRVRSTLVPYECPCGCRVKIPADQLTFARKQIGD